MEYYNCPGCQRVVQRGQTLCASCGRTLSWPDQQPNPPKVSDIGHTKIKPLHALFIIIGVFTLAVVVAFVIANIPAKPIFPTPAPVRELSISEIKGTATSIPYDDLMRHNEKYVGRIVHYRGKLVQVVSSYESVYTLRLATKQTEYLGYSDDIVWINYKGERLLEKDIVDVWGKVKGLQAYSALFGNQVTIPEIDSLVTELVTKGTD